MTVPYGLQSQRLRTICKQSSESFRYVNVTTLSYYSATVTTVAGHFTKFI